MRDFLQAERRFAHLAHARPQGLVVLGAEIRMVRKAALEFVNRLGGDAGGEDFVQALEGIVEALEARNALLDGKIRMVRKAALEFVNRLGGDAGGEDFVQALEGIVEALEARNALLDGK